MKHDHDQAGHGSQDRSAGHHHHHSGHTAVAHEPPPRWVDAYTRALEAAEPNPGRSVITVVLEAAEFDWEFKAGRRTTAWGFNGQVPGPTLEAQVGDVLEVHLRNHLPEATARGAEARR
jgi:FtsP/CotA-like multicopper oxidase with cupredoxin domain